MSRRYRVEHRTEYAYSDDVSTSYGFAHLIPREAPGQHVASAAVTVVPAPSEQRGHTDFYGNASTYFAVYEPHRSLAVTSASEVDVDRPRPDVAELDASGWEQVAEATTAELDAVDFRLASPLARSSPQVDEYAANVFAPGLGIGSALAGLNGKIHSDFAYVSGSTTVRTTLVEVLARRQGVCQDFAHLAVGCARAVGLAARYVSGYLETQPPPGKPKLQGADASHAWASVLVPGVGWIDIDPTNDQFADDSYVVAGWGRDYSDVPPLKGVILTDASKSTMRVSVDVTRLG